MNKSVVFILVGAICTAFIVAFSVQAFLTPEETTEGDSGMKMAQILVAAENLSEGEVIEPGKLRWADWPESAVLKGSFVKSSDIEISDLSIIDQAVRRDVQMGEPILETVAVSASGGNFLAAKIGSGMLAFSIPVSPSSSVGGFARPGDHVDVILTYNLRISASDQQRTQGFVQRYASETVLNDVRVLAVDQTAQEDEREAKIGKVVTLEVSPKGAEVLALAMEMGDITLALRRLGAGNAAATEESKQPTTDVGISRTLQGLNKLQSQSIDGAEASGIDGNSSTTSIRIYSGGESERITVPLARQPN
ncbi:MAG: Flp pilus assembly protein CpaB [Pseudomonadota bacterium]